MTVPMMTRLSPAAISFCSSVSGAYGSDCGSAYILLVVKRIREKLEVGGASK